MSATTIARLKEVWTDEHKRWSEGDLSAKSYVYVWADGVYLQARLEDEANCILVIIGATPEGKKELLGFVDGARESAHDWRALLLDLKRRGLSMAPKVAVADGALGFWKAIGEVWPKTGEQGTVRLFVRRAGFPSRTNRALTMLDNGLVPSPHPFAGLLYPLMDLPQHHQKNLLRRRVVPRKIACPPRPPPLLGLGRVGSRGGDDDAPDRRDGDERRDLLPPPPPPRLIAPHLLPPRWAALAALPRRPAALAVARAVD